MGVPSGEALAGLFASEHTLYGETAGDGFEATTGHVEIPAWPTDSEIEAHRRLSVEVRQ